MLKGRMVGMKCKPAGRAAGWEWHSGTPVRAVDKPTPAHRKATRTDDLKLGVPADSFVQC